MKEIKKTAKKNMKNEKKLINQEAQEDLAEIFEARNKDVKKLEEIGNGKFDTQT